MRIEAHTVPCPFKIGDRIQELRGEHTVFSNHRIVSYRAPEPDVTKPFATVTEITPSGFRYEYDRPIVLVARWGITIEGGECYAAGFGMWRRLSA